MKDQTFLDGVSVISTPANVVEMPTERVEISPVTIQVKMPNPLTEEERDAHRMLLGMMSAKLAITLKVLANKKAPCIQNIPVLERSDLTRWVVTQLNERRGDFVQEMLYYLDELVEKLPDPLQWLVHLTLKHPEDRKKILFAYEAAIMAQHFWLTIYFQDTASIERISVANARTRL